MSVWDQKQMGGEVLMIQIQRSKTCSTDFPAPLDRALVCGTQRLQVPIRPFRKASLMI